MIAWIRPTMRPPRGPHRSAISIRPNDPSNPTMNGEWLARRFYGVLHDRPYRKSDRSAIDKRPCWRIAPFNKVSHTILIEGEKRFELSRMAPTVSAAGLRTF